MLNDDKMGVYFIANLVSGMFYIGSASISFYHRWYEHLRQLRKNEHGNKHLQNAWNKNTKLYGEKAFEFGIYGKCDTRKECVPLEQTYLDKYNDTVEHWKWLYNNSPTAGSSLGVKRTKEQIENSKIAKNESYKRRVANGELRTPEEQHLYEMKMQRIARANRTSEQKKAITKQGREWRANRTLEKKEAAKKKQRLRYQNLPTENKSIILMQIKAYSNKPEIKERKKEYERKRYLGYSAEEIKKRKEYNVEYRARPETKKLARERMRRYRTKKKLEKQQAAIIAANTYGQLSMFN